MDRASRDENGIVISDLPASRDLLAQAFETRVGAQSGPIDFGAGEHVWLDVDEIFEARDRTLEEVRDRVATDWTVNVRSEMVRKKADELIARLGEGTTIAALSTETGAPVETAGPLSRNGATEIFIREAVAEGFKGQEGAVFTAPAATPGNILLGKVASVVAPTGEGLEQLVEAANESASNDLLNQLIITLQNSYSVTQNPASIDYALTNQR